MVKITETLFFVLFCQLVLFLIPLTSALCDLGIERGMFLYCLFTARMFVLCLLGTDLCC